MADVNIKLNEVAKLHIQTDLVTNEPFIARIIINGMPLQPRILYPDFSEMINYIQKYGFIIPEKDWNIPPEGNEPVGVLPKSVIEEIKDLW